MSVISASLMLGISCAPLWRSCLVGAVPTPIRAGAPPLDTIGRAPNGRSSGRDAACACAEGVVGAHSHHIAHRALADAAAQLTAAVYLIAGREGGAHPVRAGALHQPAGQLRLAGEHPLPGDAG